MKYHPIGYLILLMLLQGCASLSAAPVLQEITIKIGLKPAVVIQGEAHP